RPPSDLEGEVDVGLLAHRDDDVLLLPWRETGHVRLHGIGTGIDGLETVRPVRFRSRGLGAGLAHKGDRDAGQGTPLLVRDLAGDRAHEHLRRGRDGNEDEEKDANRLHRGIHHSLLSYRIGDLTGLRSWLAE